MKTLKRVAIALIAILILLWFAFSWFAEPVLKSTISEKISRYETDSVSIESIKLSFFPLGVRAKNIYLDISIPGDSVLKRWRGSVKSVTIGRIAWLKAWRQKEFEIGRLKIKEPSIAWVSTTSALTIPADSSSKPLHTLHFSKIVLSDLHFTSNEDSTEIELTAGFEIENLEISKKDSLNWSAERFRVSSKNASFQNIIEDYDLAFRSLTLDSQDSLLNVKHFIMAPRLSREEFVKKYPYRKPQPEMTLGNITLTGIEIPKKRPKLIAKKLIVDSCVIDLYQDIRLDRPDVKKPMPSELIAKANFPLHIDSVIITNTKLDYHHRPQQEDLGLAHLSLNDITLKAFPISNIGHSDCADLTLQIDAILENRPHLKLEARFLPDKKYHNFEVDLSMTSTELGAFNDILFPTTGLKIKEGHCTGARIKMTGNDFAVQGYLDIAYTNLRVALPPNQKEELKFFKKSLESLGNFAAINSNNQMGNKRGEIFYKRPVKEPFVNFWWKGIQSGLLDVITPFYANPDKKKS